jgi:hypothetical protein
MDPGYGSYFKYVAGSMLDPPNQFHADFRSCCATLNADCYDFVFVQPVQLSHVMTRVAVLAMA